MLFDYNQQNPSYWCFVKVKGCCSENKESNKEMRSFSKKMKEELQTTHILSIFSTFYQMYILNRLNNYNN